MNRNHSTYCVMLVAGEASGDLHGANLVSALKKKIDSVYFCGIGGQRLREAGVDIFLDASEISVIGVSEVLTKFRGILKGFRIARNLLKHKKPDLLILIDFPDFNFIVAHLAKKFHIPVLYYISPQIWAWRTGRVKRIKKLVNHMAVILPFEEPFYRKHNIPVTYVGHPLLDTSLGYGEINKPISVEPIVHPVIGFLPGSREGEINRHLPTMLQAADLLKERFETCSFIISHAPSIQKSLIQSILNDHTGNASFDILSGGASRVFQKADLVIAASGTVTLEAALSGVPMIVIYKVSDLSYRIGKAMIRVSHICLANLIAGKTVVPELIQEDASAENLAETAENLLRHPMNLIKMQDEFRLIRHLLGNQGASHRTADIAKHMLISSAYGHR